MRRKIFGFESESVLDLYNLLLAVVLFASPWFFAHASRTAGLDLWLSSAAIIILSIAAMIAYSTWEEWINLALGLWLVASPYMLGFAHTRAMHFSIGIGSAIAFFAGLELWLRYEAAHRREMPADEIPGNISGPAPGS
jgi:SPW repeat